MRDLRARLRGPVPLLAVNPGGVALPVVDVLAEGGADLLFIDCERTAVDIGAVPALARAAQAVGMGALVRSPSKDPAVLTRYLDCGLEGLVLPQVEHPDACALLAEVVRRAPHRTAPPLRIVQVESVAGHARLDDIAAADIDLILIGPNDLAWSMGHDGDTAHPDVRAAVDDIARRLADRGVPFGLPVTAATAASWARRGARLFYASLRQCLLPAIENLRATAP
ncbi:aldolase/citrate lyase family protein [Xanthobacter sp. ZOL 2024]